MTTTTQLLSYECTLGLSAMQGRGFYYPTDTVIGDNGRLYVVNRSVEIVEIGVRVTMCDMDSEFYGTFGFYGREDGQFVWHAAGAMNSQGHIYLTDEYLHRVSVFDADGNFLEVWGTHGSGEGELDGPCGIAFDADDNLYVSDTYNNRVQKFTTSGVHLATIGEGTLSMPWKLTVAPSGDMYVADWGNDRIARFTADGEFVASYGEHGSGEGQLVKPASVAVDAEGNVDVADWGNDRIARFTADGEFVASYGEHGRGEGQLLKPASVAVDTEGNVYVADWGNERVQAFDADGNFVQLLRGEATLSAWAINFLNINREEGEARSRANLELDLGFLDPDDPHDVSSKIEKYFWSPVSVKLDGEGRLFVTESNRARVQVYRVAS